MRDLFSQTKSTDNRPSSGKSRTLLLVILAAVSVICAVCAFSLMPRSAVSYAASWPTTDECESEVELECNVYAYGHEGEEDYRYKVSLIFEEGDDELVQGEGYVFNKYPKYYKLTIPGLVAETGYRCVADQPRFGNNRGSLLDGGTYYGSAYAVASLASASYYCLSLERFEADFKSGDYTIRFEKYEAEYKNGDWMEVDETREDVVCSFSIHTDPPSLVSIPEYTNSNFTIESDGNGGVIDRIYMFYMRDGEYELVADYEGESYTVDVDDLADGQYQIYVEDALGQRSDDRYVYIDREPPTINQQNNKDWFHITASDNLGTDKVWVADADGNIVSDGNDYYLQKSGLEYGYYEFYAIDAAGNVSDTITVSYSAESALGYFNYELGISDGGEERYLLSFEWEDVDHYTAQVKFESADPNYASFEYTDYDAGAVFYAEGAYSFSLTIKEDGATRITEGFNYTIDHEWVQADDTDISTLPCDQTIQLVCLQCGAEKEGGIGTMQHTYNSDSRVLVSATCTEDAYYVYTCAVCGASYIDTVADSKKGHTNTYTSFVATCLNDSYWADVCTICGYVDLEHATVFENTALGHAYIPDDSDPEWIEPTCTEDGKRISYCDRCGDRLEEVINAYGHDYSIFVGERYDEETDNMYYYYQCSICGVQMIETIYKYKSGTAYRETDDEGNELLVIWDTETGIVTFSYLSASGEDLADELVVYISWGDGFAQVSAPAMIDLFEYDAAGDFTVTVYGRGDAELCALSISLSDDSLEDTEEDEYVEEDEESGSLRTWVVVVIVVAVVAALVIVALVLYFVLSRRKKKPDDDDDYDDEEGLFGD